MWFIPPRLWCVCVCVCARVCAGIYIYPSRLLLYTHTHTRTHARTHARTLTRTLTRTQMLNYSQHVRFKYSTAAENGTKSKGNPNCPAWQTLSSLNNAYISTITKGRLMQHAGSGIPRGKATRTSHEKKSPGAVNEKNTPLHPHANQAWTQCL